MAQTQPSRDVQHATESGREDSTKPQQQHKESGKAGNKAAELAKSDSARKRVQQLAAEAAEGAEEALKKVAELQAGVAEVVEEEATKTETKKSEAGDKAPGEKANGGEKTSEHEDGPTKKSAKFHPEQSPGSIKEAANGEKTTKGASHGEDGQQEGENGARITNGGAVAGGDVKQHSKENGSQEAAVPAVGEDTISLGNPSLTDPAGESFSGHLDLNQSLQGSTLAGAAQEALKAVEQAVGTGPGRDALASAVRNTPAANLPKGPAPMQED